MRKVVGGVLLAMGLGACASGPACGRLPSADGVVHAGIHGPIEMCPGDVRLYRSSVGHARVLLDAPGPVSVSVAGESDAVLADGRTVRVELDGCSEATQVLQLSVPEGEGSGAYVEVIDVEGTACSG